MKSSVGKPGGGAAAKENAPERQMQQGYPDAVAGRSHPLLDAKRRS